MGVLWLVCDTSGSMVEGGKRLIVRGLVRQVEQFQGLGYGPRRELKLVAWSNDATVQAWNLGDEVPRALLESRGSADGSALVRLLGVSTGDQYLILTDGFWPDESRDALERWRGEITGDALRIIKVGADANQKLTGPDVFEAEDFFGAVDGWLDK